MRCHRLQHKSREKGTDAKPRIKVKASLWMPKDTSRTSVNNGRRPSSTENMALDLWLAGLAMASTSGSWASPAPLPSSGLFPTGMMRTLDIRKPHNPGDSDVLCPWVHVPPPRPHFLLLITQSLKSSPNSSNPTALCRCGQSPKAAGQRKRSLQRVPLR